MITQADLYNEVLKRLNQNAVDQDALDKLSKMMEEKLSTSKELISQASEIMEKMAETAAGEGRSIFRKLSSSREMMGKASEIIGKMSETVDPIIATGIYERINILKDDIDLFEDEILSKLLDKSSAAKMPSVSFHGLRSKGQDRINVFLVGEFSAGKTTFIGRLIDDFSGHISGARSTACLVVHENATEPGLAITYKKISVKDQENLVSFLKRYDLYRDFTDKNESLDPKVESRTIDVVTNNWTTNNILSFLKEANAFPGIFKQIVWSHKKPKKKKYAFLEYINLYDMPGFGGDINHDQVIEDIFNENKPDIVLYLIDTDRGIPSDEEVPALSKLLKSVMQHKPIFCWVFQKPTGRSSFEKEPAEKNGEEPTANTGDMESLDTDNEGFLFDEEYLKKKKKALNNFIYELVNADNFIQQKTAEISNEKELEIEIQSAEKFKGLFDNDQVAYLLKSFILDARGPSDDIEGAQNSVSMVLQKYYASICNRYCKEAKIVLASRSEKSLEVSQQKVMQYKPNDDGKNSSKNSFIEEEILNKIKEARNDYSLDNARNIFSDALSIEVQKPKKKRLFFAGSRDDGNDDAYADLSGYPFDLKATLKDMRTVINATVDEMLEAIKAKKQDAVSLDSIELTFWKKYLANDSWQKLLFTVQAYHWLKASYDGLIAPQYISNIGFAMLRTIENDVKRLTETNNLLPMITSLYEKDL